MTPEDRIRLEELDRDHKRRSRRENLLTAAVFVIGLLLAVLAGYAVTVTDEGIRSIKCEEGDVTLVVERADGIVERVECPADVPVRP